MAVTIVRTPWIDDDGSGTTGTVLNNAIKTELYGQIDGALAQLVPGSNDLLNSTAFGAHRLNASGTGGQVLQVSNTAAGTGNYAALNLGNNAALYQTFLQVHSTTYTASGDSLPDGTLFGTLGSGGLTLSARHGSGTIRFYSGGTVERMRLTAAGEFLVGAVAPVGASKVLFAADNAVANPLVLQNLNIGNTNQFQLFMNSAGVIAGTISHTGATSVAYNTTSDQRLKEDLGVAEDLTALRGVVVHDFVWSAHGGHDRGVFAQETFPVFPRAISVGSPGEDLSKPWMTDYSKFVPDLIIGWQEHDRRLARLESLVSEKD